MEIKKVLVIGAGQMGLGIAQVCAEADYEVKLYDVAPSLCKKGIERITKILARDVEKERKTEADKAAVLSRITTVAELKDAADVDLVIEAIVENVAIKQTLLKELDQLMPAKTILASNTSSLSITELASVTNRPEKVIGMHFMNPVPVMKLVEIIRGLATSDEIYNTIESMTKRLNKTPVEVNDAPGFVANRILLPMINEAIYTLYEGIADREAIDNVMTLGMNHPMGPLTLADFIGLDTCLSIMEVLHENLGDSKYRPCPLLRKYVAAGWLGKKTGRGFYQYE